MDAGRQAPWTVPLGKTAFISLASDENCAFRAYMEDGQQAIVFDGHEIISFKRSLGAASY